MSSKKCKAQNIRRKPVTLGKKVPVDVEFSEQREAMPWSGGVLLLREDHLGRSTLPDANHLLHFLHSVRENTNYLFNPECCD